MRQQFATVLVALMLVTAGCSFGGSGPGESGEPSDGTSGDAVGTINFYISDQPGAIEDFEHLNVTIDEVAFQKAEGDDDSEATATNTSTGEDDAEADDDDAEESGWQTFDVDSRTVDLTELKGANATLLQEFEVENGTYTQVRISVSDINGTLTDGSSADVKLPSEKLRINQQFTVGNNESVDFVYDINVVKRGNSGSYNIKPVAGQSGTDVPINKVGEDAEDEDADDEGDDADDDEDTPTPTATDDGNETDTQADQGRMNFYISDEKNAIDDFEHLNVTISKVGFQRGGESGNWTEYDVDNRTVDLTELKGDNATLLQTFDLQSGNYTKVFIHVDDVNGTLTDGNQTDVKLPSSKLQLNENFEVGGGEELDFVYDITVVKRGNSGSYNIKPVASESGTDVPIEKVGGEDEAEDDESEQDERGGAQQGDEATEAAAFNATFVGNVTAGENATVYVSQNGTAVENATVAYNDTEYLTGADGNATFAVPSDAEEVEVEVTYEDETVSLKETLEPDEEATETSTESEQQSGSGDAAGSDGGSGDDSGNQSTDTETETATATATPTETASS
ncbi:DUF4382 domain-containing protein [Haloglomus halophilum]|uniref:DUF4382 domain-containing protein n=1 Tax=Haloglomus halophilum TaxID=2962672 RepID=UPI0020C948D7|nr:DUF4382 domain-containing protein [Haloglomus halophilum]